MLTDKIIKAVHEDIPNINSQLEQKANQSDMDKLILTANERIIENCLLLGGEYEQGIWGVRAGMTTNLPDGFVVGIRECFRYDVNNAFVRLTDTNTGRIYTNTWATTKWTGWKEVTIADFNLNATPCCKVYHPTSQVFPGGSVKNTLAWDSILFSSHAGMCGNVGTTANIVAPVDGIYQFDASITVVGATGQIQANLSKNNEEVIDSKYLVCSGGSNALHLSGMYPMNKGDYVQIHLWHYESSPITVSNLSRFQANYVRRKI